MQQSLNSHNCNIHVIGLGVTDKAILSIPSQQVLHNAELIIGSERQLAVIEYLTTIEQQKENLPKLSSLKILLDDNRDKKIVILASGDPLFYGIGNWLIENIGINNLSFYPAVSSIQAACHLIGIALQNIEVLSLHGRPLEKIRTKIKSQHNLMVLTDQHSQPKHLAQECISAGYSEAVIWVCENMGYPQQTVRRFNVEELLNQEALTFDPLHVSLIQTSRQSSFLPEFPGISDVNYITGKEPGKGMITKREVRLAILSILQPSNNDVIWDVGAGCGGVSIELAYWNEKTSVYAIEDNKERLDSLGQNRNRFGVVSNLKIIAQRAPGCLTELPQANKVFIGGSGGELEVLLTLCWSQLPENGLLVASAVTENSKNTLLRFSQKLQQDSDEYHTHDFETLQIAVSKGKSLAAELMYKPNLTVTLYKFHKIKASI